MGDKCQNLPKRRLKYSAIGRRDAACIPSISPDVRQSNDAECDSNVTKATAYIMLNAGQVKYIDEGEDRVNNFTMVTYCSCAHGISSS